MGRIHYTFSAYWDAFLQWTNPYIGIAAAQYQLHRVALARGLSDGEAQTFVNQYTKGRQFGFLGNLR